MEYNLGAFAGVDPNVIYNQHDEENPPITFFFNKEYNSGLYPDTHDDLLLKKEVFYDVFPNAVGVIRPFKTGNTYIQIEDFLNYTPKDSDKPWLDNKLKEMDIDPVKFRKTLGPRIKADIYGSAIAGRVGIYNKDLVISLWQSSTHPRFNDLISNQQLIADIFRNFGRKYPMNEWILVPHKEEPRLFKSEFKGVIAPAVEKEADKKKLMVTPKYATSYRINNFNFTIEELKGLRGVLHSSTPSSNNYNAALAVLCHKDMDKYPELSGFIPPNKCPRQSAPQLPQNSFKNASKNMYMKQANTDKKASTSLLYEPWRATSESNSFVEWLSKRESGNSL